MLFSNLYFSLIPDAPPKDIFSLISKILYNYIYWLGLEFNVYVKDKDIKKASDLIIEFYHSVNDTRAATYLIEDLLSLYILPLEEESSTANHINTFIAILKEIKARKIFDQSIYNTIIDSLVVYALDEYNQENLKPKGLTQTQLKNLFETLNA